ncbi:MAG: hypothetical protein O9345_22015 [Burkholderiaceae bacterium]|nr:hypothetical protein [Burkholderiales bacterium]MCZ8340795.1 hypothetical protein [Burkholderiaceae bacterium]
MNRTVAPLSRLVASIAVCGALVAPAVAQDAKPAPAAKPAAQKPAPKRPANVPPPTTAEQMADLPHADEEQRQAATLVHYGKYVCDEKFEVFIERNPVFSGYVDVRYKRDVWVMKPVASRTGAVRLEDTRGKVLLVQIPFKSMLLNTQTGQRIIDSCQHDNQRDAEKQAKSDPSSQTSNLK